MSGHAPGATYGKLTLMALLWGGTFIGGRIAAPEMGAAVTALWRYLIAVVLLLGFAFLLEGGLPRPTPRQWIGVVLVGATGVFVFNLCFMYGLARVPASRASLIMALNPAVTLLGAVLFLGERLTRNKVVGIAVALAGVAVVLGRGNPLHLLGGGIGFGEVVLFGCPVAWAANALIARRMLPDMSPVAATTWSALAGGAMLAGAAAVSGPLVPVGASWQAWAALVFLGTFGTAVALVLFYDGVRRIGAARTAVFINLVPVFAVALGVLALGEPLELSMLVGGALVIGGVLLLNRPEPRGGAASHAA
ncbi:MAG: DMT family transporter [Burkholderiales bacterium]|nr:DMT family transporter [Burkholderiales bacterium]